MLGAVRPSNRKPCPYALARLRNEPNASEVFCSGARCAANPRQESAANRAIIALAPGSARTGASWQRSLALPPPLVGAGPRACPDVVPGQPRGVAPTGAPGQPRRVAPTGAPGMCQSRICVLCRRGRGCVDDGYATRSRRAVSRGTRCVARASGCVRVRFESGSCVGVASVSSW